MKTDNPIEFFFNKQLAQWQLAKENYNQLHKTIVKTITIKGTDFKVQFNPARITSTSAKVDTESIRQRVCFLCSDNRPTEQISSPFKDNYEILVNPYPVFPRHFTIPEKRHTPQLIKDRVEDMLDLTEWMQDYVVFYNGAKCGASAPDHFHFQAGNKGFLPLEVNFNQLMTDTDEDKPFFPKNYPCPAVAIRSKNKKTILRWFDKVIEKLQTVETDRNKITNSEPMMNILCWKQAEYQIMVIIPRLRHRPSVYFAEGDRRMVISPASLDLAGVFITPIERDFTNLNKDILTHIISETCWNKKELNKLQINER